MNRSIAKSICSTLADYRAGEIPKRTPDDVERWLNQFDAGDRPVILAETDRLLTQFYISKEIATDFIDRLWKTEDLAGEKPENSVKDFKFLNIQRHGSSQKSMLQLADASLRSNYGLKLADCGARPSAYVYLDDCAFTGNTVVHDLNPAIATLNKGSVLHLVFLAHHRGAHRYVEKTLGPLLQERNIKYHLWSSYTFENLPWVPDDYQLFWPCEVTGDDLVDRYLAKVQSACEGRSFTPRLFRAAPRRNEDVFSSPEVRQVVESAFLRKGAYIIAQCTNPKQNMRPLGYESLSSLGFGAIVVTYRNIANNCPLALWWGDPDAPPSHPFSKWFPLIPRKGN